VKFNQFPQVQIKLSLEGDTMIRSLGLSTALLSLVLLMSSVSALAQTGGTYVPNPGSAMQIKAVGSAFNPTQVPAIWASTFYTDGGGDSNGNANGNSNGDANGNSNGDANGNSNGNHDPTPEPSTILSFGAAVLIGGGVLYSRRLRRNRK
jgi:hypothetical protein